METHAKELHRIFFTLGQGDQVDEALYKFATRPAASATPVAVSSWAEAAAAFHEEKIDDQFLPPMVRVDGDGKPVGVVRDGDSLVYHDFRTDRAKPLTAAFLDQPYGGQVGGLSEEAAAARPKLGRLVTMTHYDDNFTSDVLREAFNPAKPLEDTYAEVAGVPQLVVAESEKWRAVTWFKDGRRNLGYEAAGSDGIVRTERSEKHNVTVRIVESRKVAAHIQAPEMRAKEICDELLKGVEEGVEDIFANFANADMVAHAMTDVDEFPGVVKAITVLDEELGRLVPAALEKGYVVMITGDHGNAESMVHADTGKANPAHTTNKVPFVLLGLTDAEKNGGKAHLDAEMTIGEMAPIAAQLRGLSPQPESWDRTTALRDAAIEKNPRRRIMKLVLDGYGVRDEAEGNAMAVAAEQKGSPLHMDRWANGEDGAIFARAEASGLKCGYPEGEAGTTEFGHVLFDAGRTVRSDVTLIDHALESGEFAKNEALRGAFENAAESGQTVHVMGITSDGMVHSSLRHLEGLLGLAQELKVPKGKLSLHVISDGRDVPGDSSPKYLKWLDEAIAKYGGIASINSVWGRGWGKDRDNRWKRIESAFRSLAEGTAAVHVQIKEE